MTKKKKVIVITLILLILTTSLTFAYFMTQMFGDNITIIELATEDKTLLIFDKGDDIELLAGIDNFYEDSGDLYSTTYPRVRLISNETLRERYNIYFNILYNDFIYTTETEEAELILKVIDETGTEITEIEGLTYISDGDITGFDITDKEGAFPVYLDKIIEVSDNTTIHDWEFSVYFINLDTSQNANAGKTLDAQIYMDQEYLCVNKIYGVFADTILLNNGNSCAIEDKGIPDYSIESIINDGMYAVEDAYGMSYYFRGAVDNNWVVFANTYWRIIRVNGDGSVRLIYTGIVAPTEDEAVVQMGDNTQLDNYAFNSLGTLAEYAGYMYTLGEQHGLANDSLIKNYVDDYYEESLLAYDSYIADNIFCYSRISYTDTNYTERASGTGTSEQYFESYKNVYSDFSLTCENKLDNYSTEANEYGNGALTYPVAILTQEEMILAGMIYTTADSKTKNYLYNGIATRLGNPGYVNSSGVVYNRMISLVGYAYDGTAMSNARGVRPVISLEANLLIEGTGLYNNPYVILGTNEMYVESVNISTEAPYLINTDAYDYEVGIKGTKVISENEICTPTDLSMEPIEITSSSANKLCVYNNDDKLIEEKLNIAEVTYIHESPATPKEETVLINLDNIDDYSLISQEEIDGYDSLGWIDTDGNYISTLDEISGDIVLFANYKVVTVVMKLHDKIIEDNGGIEEIKSKSAPDLTKASVSQTEYDSLSSVEYYTVESGMYSIDDDYGKSYYFRGAVDDNWVKFGGFYWRIIRLDGNGNIKMIYSGTDESGAQLSGDDTQIDMASFNDSTVTLKDGATLPNSPEGVGYVYQDSKLHGITTNSNVKTKIDTWYNNNLLDDYDSYIANSNFCNDRTGYIDGTYATAITTNSFTGNESYIVFSGRYRLYSNYTPSLKCNDSSDILSLKAGLITGDEVSLAGVIHSLSAQKNTSYFLYSGTTYWTMTPSYYAGRSYTQYVYSTGGLHHVSSASTSGIRPVISLDFNVILSSGNGTIDDPYEISYD